MYPRNSWKVKYRDKTRTVHVAAVVRDTGSAHRFYPLVGLVPCYALCHLLSSLLSFVICGLTTPATPILPVPLNDGHVPDPVVTLVVHLHDVLLDTCIYGNIRHESTRRGNTEKIVVLRSKSRQVTWLGQSGRGGLCDT